MFCGVFRCFIKKQIEINVTCVHETVSLLSEINLFLSLTNCNNIFLLLEMLNNVTYYYIHVRLFDMKIIIGGYRMYLPQWNVKNEAAYFLFKYISLYDVFCLSYSCNFFIYFVDVDFFLDIVKMCRKHILTQFFFFFGIKEVPLGISLGKKIHSCLV